MTITSLLKCATVFNMPKNGDCFYACFVHCCESFSWFQTEITHLRKLYAKTKKEGLFYCHDEPTPIQLVRFATALECFEEEFEKYKVLCIGEIDNKTFTDIEDLRIHIAFTNSYANQVTIDMCIRAFGGRMGVCIVSNESDCILSPSEWIKTKTMILLYDTTLLHYDVVQMPMKDKTNEKMYPLAVTQKMIDKMRGHAAPSNPLP